ncbi:MAG: DUF6174 domain-containing protein [Gemmatimonadaceae bacterium]
MQLRHALRALSVAVLVAASACSGTLLTGNDGGRQADLTAARLRWNSTRPAKYEYTLTISCFCAFSRPVTVTVDGTTVVSRTYADDGTPFTSSFAASFPTIDGLFDIVADAISRKAATLESSYDPVTGIPLTVTIDYVVNAADDEVSYRATNFKLR